MKKSNLYILLAVGALGVMTFSTKLTAVEASMPGCAMGGCCGGAPETTAVADSKATPDLLTTCPVSGDKLGGDMGKPYTFTYKEQEVKLCCKSCKRDFDKDPEKYMKLIRAADKK